MGDNILNSRKSTQSIDIVYKSSRKISSQKIGILSEKFPHHTSISTGLLRALKGGTTLYEKGHGRG
jgi:hypothetical protein